MVCMGMVMCMGMGQREEYGEGFGFKGCEVGGSLWIGLGRGESSGVGIGEGYSVFGNGGYKI